MTRAVRWAVLVIGAVLLVMFPYWSAAWESSRFATTVLRDMLVFAVFALSLDLLVGYAGMPSLGHAAFFGAGAYAAGITGQRLATDQLPVTLGAAALVGAVLALVIGALVVRSEGIFFLMLTLALAQMVFAIAFQWTALTGGSNGLSGVGRPTLAGIDFNAPDRMYVLATDPRIRGAVLAAMMRSSRRPRRATTETRRPGKRLCSAGFWRLARCGVRRPGA